MKRKLLSIKICRGNLLWLLFCLVSTGCQRTIYWDLGAKGTLKDETGACFPSSLSGTFYSGIIPGSDTAFIEVKVNVFSPGTYTVSTDLQNGLQFIDSGYFSTTGIHSVKLKPFGKAISPEPTNFTIRFDTSACAFTLNVEDSSLLNKDLNTWRFTDTKNKISYQGVINATYFLATSENNLLSLRQESTNPGDTIFQVGVAFQGPLGPGIFKTDTLNNLALSTNGRCINCAWGVIFKLKGAVTTIVIQSYDSRTKIIKGTFSGTTVDWNESVATIEDGKFSAVLR
jgi:hypothetical protein